MAYACTPGAARVDRSEDVMMTLHTYLVDGRRFFNALAWIAECRTD